MKELERLKGLRLLGSSGWHFPNVNGCLFLFFWKEVISEDLKGLLFPPVPVLSINDRNSILEQNKKRERKKERFYLYKPDLHIPHVI